MTLTDDSTSFVVRRPSTLLNSTSWRLKPKSRSTDVLYSIDLLFVLLVSEQLQTLAKQPVINKHRSSKWNYWEDGITSSFLLKYQLLSSCFHNSLTDTRVKVGYSSCQTQLHTFVALLYFLLFCSFHDIPNVDFNVTEFLPAIKIYF